MPLVAQIVYELRENRVDILHLDEEFNSPLLARVLKGQMKSSGV